MTGFRTTVCPALCAFWIGLAAGCGTATPKAEPQVVEVTTDGRVIHDGHPATINSLIHAVRGSKRPVTLRASEDALWMHLQWVMAALHEAGITSVRTTEGQDLPLSSGYLEDRFDYPLSGFDDPEPVVVRSVLVQQIEAGGAAYVLYYDGESAVVRGSGAIREWARAQLEKAGKEGIDMRWAVEATGAVPYRRVLTAVDDLRAAGVEDLQLGVEALHPWDRDRPILPDPPHNDPIWRWMLTDLTMRRMFPVNLPVAPMCAEDKDNDEDDRLIISLTASGRILWKGEPIPLAGLAERLKTATADYERKQTGRGKEGFRILEDGGSWSRLFVLLRADQDAPWGHVRWVMAEIREARIYKLQFGARKFPSKDLTPKEANRMWAGWAIHGLPLLDGELAAFLPTSISDSSEADPDLRIVFEPGTRFRKVVVAINALYEADMERVEFAELTRAPQAVRRMPRLPPPR